MFGGLDGPTTATTSGCSTSDTKTASGVVGPATWTLLAAHSETGCGTGMGSVCPLKRYYHAATMVGPSTMVVFGGSHAWSSKDKYNDVWTLDVSMGAWMLVLPHDGGCVKEGTTGCPVRRGAHSSVVIGGLVVVFGGVTTSGACGSP